MKIKKEKVQSYVNKFLPEIRKKLNIPVEDITVKETSFYVDKYNEIVIGMETQKGEMFIDPCNNYNSKETNIEATVLHELGHRALEKLNPSFEEELIKKSNGDFNEKSKLKKLYQNLRSFINNKKFIIYTLQEGLSECFAFNIFPEVCDVSDKARKFIEKRDREYYKGSFKGGELIEKLFTQSYFLFKGMHSREGLEGIKSYIEGVSYHAPITKEDLLDPSEYLKKFMGKIKVI